MRTIALTLLSAAELLLVNGNVVTLDEKAPRAEAVAIAKGKILFVGSRAGAEKTKGPATKVVDLGGATVVPGLVDAHAHLESLGFDLQELRLSEEKSFESVVERVSGHAKTAKPGTWVSGSGWDQNDWIAQEGFVGGFPTNDALSKAVPDRPVALSRVDGHALLVNAKALELARIGKDTPDPVGGKIVRGPDGAATGVLVDNAMDLVSKLIPSPTVAESKAAILRAQAECFRLGLTGLHDMGVGARELQAYEELLAEKKLKLRVYAMLQGSDAALVKKRLAAKPVIAKDGVLTVRGIKYFADGALGSRGATLLADYSDDPGNKGLPTAIEAELVALTKSALAAGFQVCVHAIGDAANRTVLNAYEKALKATPKSKDARLRIEHAQVIALEDIPRFAKLGVVASMQPTHATSDMPWAEKRVGPERIAGAYAWRKLLASGARIAAGSDFPVEGVSPLWGYYAAVTRQDHAGLPAGGWRPEEVMTREEALRAFTVEAAWTGFEEKSRGTIAAGKLADLTVLDRDLLTVPAAEILKTQVRMTVVGGAVVYDGGSTK